MAGPRVYGIDFGTTNSSVAAVVNGQSVVVPAEPSTDPPEAMRSLVFLHRDGDRDAGRDAARKYLMTAGQRHTCHTGCDRVAFDQDGAYSDCRQFRNRSGGCRDARLISGIKPLLTSATFDETSSWASVFTAPDLVSIILADLKAAADDHFGTDVRNVVLGHPVNFQTSKMGDQGFTHLQKAAEEAGFAEVEFCPEPVAAVSSDVTAFAGKTVCSVDFGGGTFDVVILRFDASGDGSSDLLGIDGVSIGGEMFDARLFDAFVAPALEIDKQFETRRGKTRLSAQIRTKLRTMGDVIWLAADPEVTSILRQFQQQMVAPEELEAILDLLYGGQAFDFFSELEMTKKRLSEVETAAFSFRKGSIDLEFTISRWEFEELIAGELRDVKASIERALSMADLKPREVDLVIRTGGSALLPAFNDILDDLFGAIRVESRPTFTSVAAGLAQIGSTMWEG